MIRYTCLILLLLYTYTGWAQPTRPADYGLKAFTIHDPSLGDIHFYISSKDIHQTKPLLLALDGSGHFPMAIFVQLRKKAFLCNTLDNDALALADKFHVVMISKPGVPFCDTLNIDRDSASTADVMELLTVPAAYTKRAGLAWRVNAASKVIDFVCRHMPVDKKKVVVYGYSEGAQVVPKLSLVNKKITHCAAIVGSGLNQFYDWIVDVRTKASQGLISQEDAQRQVDSLFAQFAAIYAAPHDIYHKWEGHTYQRWAGYCSDIPLDNLVKLNIPVFIAAGSRDHNSSIYSLEYIRLEFLRRGKKNLSFHVYPTDHYFNEVKLVDGQAVTISHKQDMMRDLLNWMNEDRR